MDIHIDKLSLYKIAEGQKDFFFSEIGSAIATELKVHFPFKKEDIRDNEYAEAFFKKYAQAWPKERRIFEHNADYINFSTTDSHNKIFLNEDVCFKSESKNKGVLACKSCQIEEVFERIFFKQKKKNFEFSGNLRNKFKSWSHFSSYFLPLNDIIIVDPFVFDLEESLIKINLEAAIKGLVSNSKNEINCVIYTLKDKLGKKPAVSWCNQIQNLIESKTKNKANVTLISVGGHDKTLTKKLKEHDRSIVSNYFILVIGDSLTFVDKQGNVKENSRYFSLKSHCKKENHEYTDELIYDLQQAIEVSRTRATVEVTGAKKSNFLKF